MPKPNDRMLELIGSLATSASLIDSGDLEDVVDEMINILAQDELELPTDQNQLQNQISLLEECLIKCHSERDSISCKLTELELNKDKLKKLSGKRVGIIGGHVDEIKKIEEMLADLGIKCRRTAGEGSVPPYPKLKEKYCNVDLLIILNGYAGHALTGQAERLSDEFGIRKVYDSADLLNSIKLKVIEALA